MSSILKVKECHEIVDAESLFTVKYFHFVITFVREIVCEHEQQFSQEQIKTLFCKHYKADKKNLKCFSHFFIL
jgi:hypothetical protein